MTERGRKTSLSSDHVRRVRLQESTGTDRFAALLTLPNRVVGAAAGPRLVRAIRSLVAALPTGGSIVVAGHSEALHAIGRWPELAGIRVNELPVASGVDFTPWAQDGFLACADEDGAPVVMLPAHDKRASDAVVVEQMATALGCRIIRAAFDFEGGNVLVGTNVVLVGADNVDSMTSHYLADLGERRTLMSLGTLDRMPGREVRLIGSGEDLTVEERYGYVGVHQPLFHLDAFITLAGKTMSGRDRVLVGDTTMASMAAEPGSLPPCDQTVSDQLDQIAEQLSKTDGLAVIRNPLSIVPVVDKGLRAWSQTTLARTFRNVDGIEDVLLRLDRLGRRTVAVRRWRAATQNGAVVFSGTGRRRVLLPTFAHGRFAYLAQSELLTRQIWTRMGFEVFELSDCTPLAAEHGSPHCMFKLLWS